MQFPQALHGAFTLQIITYFTPISKYHFYHYITFLQMSIRHFYIRELRCYSFLSLYYLTAITVMQIMCSCDNPKSLLRLQAAHTSELYNLEHNVIGAVHNICYTIIR